MKIKLALGIGLAWLAASVLILDAAAQQPGGDRVKRAGLLGHGGDGYFWYRDPALEQERSPVRQEPPGARSSTPEPETVALPAVLEPPPVDAGPAPFSAAWVRENIDVFKDRALDDPTPENVEAYLLLQRLALDKAERFTTVAARAAVNNLALDERSRAPRSTFAVQAVQRASAEARKTLLNEVSEVAGIYFFYDSTCTFCHTQAPVLQRFANTYGFEVLAISRDGVALPGGQFPDFRVDNGISEELGVTTVPALYLVVPPEGIAPLSQGILGFSELETRVLFAAEAIGLIDESDVQRTRHLQGAPVLASANVDMNVESEMSNDELVNYLRRKVRGGR